MDQIVGYDKELGLITINPDLLPILQQSRYQDLREDALLLARWVREHTTPGEGLDCEILASSVGE